MKKQHLLILGFVPLFCYIIWAQPGPQTPRPQQPPRSPQELRPQGPRPQNQPGQQTNAPFWNDPQLTDRLGLNPDQHKKLTDLGQQHRLRRIDLDANLQKAQVTLEPLWQADAPDESKILSQIDRVSQAQAELKKDEARMQLAVRQILSADQWKRLQEHNPPRPPIEGPNRGAPNGPPQGPPR
ncbi:MAG: periplasmic heavy metal sensor [Acidobacteriota bacterium]